ncbi:hypothetical protein TWF694_000945 [Orbilia ellipsospora]|uniref:Nucleotidyltransferase n=1 Tax=Orbilia ellipsospora TaxID=2528407 RepID=A0AAV9XRP2_9PEZI
MSSPEDIIEAATEVSRILKQIGVSHAIIGGAAGNLLGSERSTLDVDVLVSFPSIQVREAILKHGTKFTGSKTDLKFAYTNDGGTFVPIEFLKDGNEAALSMPDLASTPILTFEEIPLVHPSIIVCLKVGRWAWMSESARPRSRVKAKQDLHDILFLLKWLVENEEKISFEGMETNHREKYTAGFQKLSSQYKLAAELLNNLL